MKLKANLTGLVELQKVDRELQALEALRGDLPQQVARTKEKLDGLKEEHSSKKVRLADNGTAKAIAEGELKDFQAKLAKYRDQLYAVTSNREYDAITAEIDTVEGKISETEDKILAFLEEEEVLSADLETIEPEIKDIESELEDKDSELKQKILATEAECKSFEEQRSQLAASVDKRIVYQYERIRTGLGNTAVADLRNDACSGCRSNIPPQKRVEIKMMNQLILCESCGRILVSTVADTAVTT